jgi:hypothetical protein
MRMPMVSLSLGSKSHVHRTITKTSKEILRNEIRDMKTNTGFKSNTTRALALAVLAVVAVTTAETAVARDLGTKRSLTRPIPGPFVVNRQDVRLSTWNNAWNQCKASYGAKMKSVYIKSWRVFRHWDMFDNKVYEATYGCNDSSKTPADQGPWTID